MKKTLHILFALCFSFFIFVALSGVEVSFSQNPNWAQDIAPILYAKCTSCHHKNGLAPFPLITYSDAQAWSGLMKQDVLSGKMPPWSPDTSYHTSSHQPNRFVNERILSQQEINEIVTWVNNGSPQGNPSSAPTPPTYPAQNIQLSGTPDLILKMPTFTSKASTKDTYVCFSIPTNLTQDRIIKALEVLPGNAAIVHHVIASEDTTGNSSTDTSGNCYTMGGQIGLGGYAPGERPIIFPSTAPNQMGIRLKAGSKIVLQIHYPAGSAGSVDSTQVRLFFYPSSVTTFREVYSSVPLTNWSLFILPNFVQTYTAHYAPLTSISLFSVFPHMHLLGKSVETYAYNGNDTIPLIKENNWDFHWQGYYTYKKLLKIPMGYTLFTSHVYDNTSNNPNNPNSPPQLVTAGTSTTNEMLFDGIQYLIYQPGDENINIDSLLNPPLTTNVNEEVKNNFACYTFPNPFTNQVTFQYYLNSPSDVKIEIFSSIGEKVKMFFKEQTGGTQQVIWDGRSESGNKISDGIYFYRIITDQKHLEGQLMLLNK
ncbi:MAG: T9SS type A sorting domain-containing protein [Bacteroidetes bacterium]|nr:T9SS type A sorting domain-containing protein [Bacteroidota bacterium]